mmetsp:Transcript_16566/g.34238  ORF Transcript_16566/g.34238 Transcript_16566/m.34238 type:complete len:203 (+) Transcript_16566:910-1518(+)
MRGHVASVTSHENPFQLPSGHTHGHHFEIFGPLQDGSEAKQPIVKVDRSKELHFHSFLLADHLLENPRVEHVHQQERARFGPCLRRKALQLVALEIEECPHLKLALGPTSIFGHVVHLLRKLPKSCGPALRWRRTPRSPGSLSAEVIIASVVLLSAQLQDALHRSWEDHLILGSSLLLHRSFPVRRKGGGHSAILIDLRKGL